MIIFVKLSLYQNKYQKIILGLTSPLSQIMLGIDSPRGQKIFELATGELSRCRVTASELYYVCFQNDEEEK